MTRHGSLLSSSDAVTPDAVIEYPGGAVVRGLAMNSAAAATANTAAINAAIVAGKRNGTGGSTPNGLGARVVLPAGDIHVNGTILIQDAIGTILEGDGHSTRLIWQGINSIDVPGVLLSHARQCVVKNLQIIKGTAYSVGIRTARDNHQGAFVTPTKNTFQNLFIESPDYSGIDIGGGNSMVDANNDFHLLENCEIVGYGNSGFRIIGSQSYNNLFLSCHASGGAGSQYGLYSNNDGNSFQWIGGGMNTNAAADFYVGRSFMPVTIENYVSELSARMVLCPDVANLNLTIRGCRYFGEYVHADTRVISINAHNLKLTMENNFIGTSEMENIPMTIYITGATEATTHYFNFSGNTIGTSITTGAELFTGHNPTHGAGNTFYINGALTW